LGIQDGTTDFPLSRDLNFSVNGATESTRRLVLREPGMEHVKFYLRLKQMLTRSQLEIAKQASEFNQIKDAVGDVVKPLEDSVEDLESQVEDTHEMFSLALQASETVDIGQFIGTFEKMVCTKAKKSVVLVDDRVPLTSALWNSLHPEDAFNVAIRWCSFFGTPSPGGQKTISARPSESHTEPMAV